MMNGCVDWPETNPFKQAVISNNVKNPFLHHHYPHDSRDEEEDVALGELFPSKREPNPIIDALVERYKLQPHPSLTFQEDCLVRLDKIDDAETLYVGFASPGTIKAANKDRYTNPLDPPPPQFSRPARASNHQSPRPFEAACIYSLRANLRQGVPNIYPTCLDSHNISADDWTRFIEDVCIIDTKGLKKSGPLPRYLHKSGDHHDEVEVAVHMWNKNFFIPRKVLVWIQNVGHRHRLLILSIP